MLVRNLIFDKTNIPLLNKALNVSSLRHKAVSNNIANVNTVNYRRKEVNFSSYLRAQVTKPKIQGQRTDPRHVPVGVPNKNKPPLIYEPDAGPNTTGINSVDIDMEMANLAENHLFYNIAAHFISGSFDGLRKSIAGQVRA